MMSGTMATMRKFKFETSFDIDVKDKQEQLEIGARSIREYTEDDLCAARDAAYAEGRNLALQEALTTNEHLITQLLPAIEQRLEDLHHANETVYAKIANDAIKVAVTIAHKVVPEFARNNAFEEIEGLVRECLNILYEEPRVVIRVHERVLDPLKQRIDEIASACGFNGNVVLFGDIHVAETDCRVEWADGGTERNLELLWREINTAIARDAGPGIGSISDSQASGPDADDTGIAPGTEGTNEDTTSAHADGRTTETFETSGS